LQAEAAHFAKIKGGPVPVIEEDESRDVEMGGGVKRALETGEEGDDEEGNEAKRRRVLEETRDIDADSEEEEDSSEDDRLVGFILRHIGRVVVGPVCLDG
jgi:protein CWC15